nr:type I polyketide synthase 3 [Streptomyces sp.]
MFPVLAGRGWGFLPVPSASELRGFLCDRIAEQCGLRPEDVETDRPTQEFGLSSRGAVTVIAAVQELLGRPLSPALVWEFPTVDRLVDGLLAEAPAVSRTPEEARQPQGEPDIAVVGIGCRLPGGVEGPAAFWELLVRGEDAVTQVPPGRWEQFGTTGEGTSRHGGFLDDVAGFDAAFFGTAPREAELMDPQQRILLEVAWEALEHAGLAPRSLAGSRTGVFVGVSSSEYAHLTTADPGRVEGWTATGAAPSITANRLSYVLDLRGPSLAVDTACSSSLVSVHLATRSLRTGETDLALAGGVNLLLSPVITRAFDEAGGTSPDGRCKAFSASADGMVRAEGCGVVVLKRLQDALRDGDEVLAVVRGSAVNSDGRSNGLVAPSVQAQRDVLREAYADARVEPGRVGYVEAHGTGTALGDPIEATALSGVLCAGRPRWRPLVIGSAKTNVGHLEAAAGITGFIKAVLVLRHRLVPASLHFDAPSPHIDFDALGLRVPTATTSWPGSTEAPLAGVSAFGFGGTNAHVVLEAAPERPAGPGTGTVRHHLLADAAHAADLAVWLDRADASVDDVAHTLARRGTRRRTRLVVTARDRDGLGAALRAAGRGEPHPAVVTGEGDAAGAAPVWVFSGYQPVWPDVRRLSEGEPVFAAAVEEIGRVVEEESGLSLPAAVRGGFTPRGPAQVMPVIYGLQLALARLWRHHGVVPAAVIGHSMGEVAAAVVAGALTVRDGARVVARRSGLLARLAGHGAMAVLGVPGARAAVEAASAGLDKVHVAVFSSPGQCVVTGDRAQIEEMARLVGAGGMFARVMAAEGAGHSPQVDHLLDELTSLLAELAPAPPHLPFYSTVDPEAPELPALDGAYWARNLREPVRFADAVAAAVHDGHRVFTEISQHPLLTLAVTDTAPGALTTGTLHRGQDPVLAFHTALATLHAHGRPVPAGGGRIVDVPLPAWHHVPHWISATARIQGHPVLGVHIELPGEERHFWRNEATAPLSAARAAEMAHTAGAHVFGTGQVALDHLWVPQPALPGPFTTGIDAQGRLTVRTRTEDGWATAAEARLTPGPAGELPAPLGEKLFEVTLRAAPLTSPAGWGRWAVLGDAAALAETLRRTGDEVTDTLDPAVTGVVLVLARTPLLPPDEAREQVATVMDVVRQIAGHARPPRLWLSAAGGALRGVVRVLAAEHPALRVTSVDTEGDVGLLCAEVRSGHDEDEVVWRDGIRHRAVLTPVTPVTPGLPAVPVVRADGGYLITGGYGGLGLAVARWLAESGARRIVLAGRNGPSPEAGKTITALREAGCDVTVTTADLTAEGSAGRLVAEVRRDGVPLRGVVHAAGALADRLALDTEDADLRRAWGAKADGAWRLHLATAQPDEGLDWWVAFSSAAATLGSPGQLAYASANSWLDELTARRRALGLPATTVNWGTWTEAGAAGNRAVALRPIVPAEGIEALHAVLAEGRAAVGVFALRPGALGSFAELAGRPYFAEVAGSVAPTAGTGRWDGEGSLTEALHTRAARLTGTVLDPDRPLLDAGLDSLAAMRMKAVIEYDFGVTVPAAMLLRGAALADIAAHVAAELGRETPPPARTAIEPRDAAERLVVRAFGRALGHTGVGVRDDFFTRGDERQAEAALQELRPGVDIPLTTDDLRAHPTAEQLAALVRQSRPEGTGPVRVLRGEGNRTPLYLAHPGGGDSSVYRDLVSRLGTGRPCYGLDRTANASQDVAARAARYAGLITGPAVLGGWSFGGVLAFETARQLAARDSAPPVVLIDAGLALPPESGLTDRDILARRLTRFARYLTDTYGHEVHLDETELAAHDEPEQLARTRDAVRRSGAEKELSPAIWHHHYTSFSDARALERYRPPTSYDGPVVLFRATDPTPWPVHEPRFDRRDEALGWDEFCTDLTVIPVPGHHFTLIDPPGVDLIAAHLRRLSR